MRAGLRVSTLALAIGFGAGTATAQEAVMPNTIEGLQSAAKRSAGLNFPGTFLRLCVPPGPRPANAAPRAPGPPPREDWYAEPAQIGDNFYFLGTRVHNAFALVANTGEIIVIDTLFEYATQDQIIDGLSRLGLDPNNVRYVLIAHAHGDHDGGARYLQDAIPGVTIVYGEDDWSAVLARTAPHAERTGPENDGTDGRVISVGDVSVRLVTMPGHTPGTLSFLFEFRDGGEPIRVAYAGGTAVSFNNSDPAYYDRYIASAEKFAEAAADYGATALLSNHTEFDNAYFKAHTAAARSGGEVRNPFVVGTQGVADYTDVVGHCATAAKLRATGTL